MDKNERLYRAVLFGKKRRVKKLLTKTWFSTSSIDVNKTSYGYSLLQIAFNKNGMEIAEMLVKNGADVNVPLLWAIENHKEKVNFLINNGANVNLKKEHKGISIFSSTDEEKTLEKENEYTPLILAIEKGYYEIVELLIENGADVNLASFWGRLPLHSALEKGNTEISELLIAKGADINARDRFGNTTLINASESGLISIVELLIAKGADIHAIADNGNTPLMGAIKNESPDIVKFLLLKGADVNQRSEAKTPLSIAASVGNKEILELLISKGADLNAIVYYGDNAYYTPLDRACNGGHFEIVKLLFSKGAQIYTKSSKETLNHAIRFKHDEIADFLITNVYDIENEKSELLVDASVNGCLKTALTLIKCGADVNYKISFDTRLFRGLVNRHITALLKALENRHKEIAELLISLGANVNDMNRDGNTPLFYATGTDFLDIAKMLIDKGADINASIINEAIKNHNLELIRILIERGADINSYWIERNPPLCAAAEFGSLEIVEYLINKGANVNIESGNGGFPLHIALKNGNVDIAKTLIRAGADVNQTKNGDDHSPLMIASNKGFKEIVELLIEKGANVTYRHKRGVCGELRDNKMSTIYWEETALTEAVLGGNIEIVKLLIEKGSVLNILTSWERTPLKCARDMGYKEIAKLLISKGAKY